MVFKSSSKRDGRGRETVLRPPLLNLFSLPPIIGLLEGRDGPQLFLLLSVSGVCNLLLDPLNFKEKIQGGLGLLCNKHI